MANDQQEKPKQVCIIAVSFPVESDEAAIAVKKKIGDAISDLDESRIDFRITNMGRRGNGPPL